MSAERVEEIRRHHGGHSAYGPLSAAVDELLAHIDALRAQVAAEQERYRKGDEIASERIQQLTAQVADYRRAVEQRDESIASLRSLLATAQRDLEAIKAETHNWKLAYGHTVGVPEAKKEIATLLAQHEQARAALEKFVAWADKNDWGTVPKGIEGQMRSAALAPSPANPSQEEQGR